MGMTLGIRVFIIALTISLSSSAWARPNPIAWSNFDWDDNLFYMPTKTVLFEKGTGIERHISTGEYAKIREQIGVSGEWEKYEIRKYGKDGSFRFVTESPSRNYFLEDIRKALRSDKDAWQGPNWKAFVQALQKESSARTVSIITARGHSPNEVYEGLQYLQKKGHIKHLPLKENLFPVGETANPTQSKIIVMRKILENLQNTPIPHDIPESLDGTKVPRKIHLWSFSDDDWKTFKIAVDELSKDVKEGKYPNVKISLFYTGSTPHPEFPPALVLTPEGGVRPFTKAETLETLPAILRMRFLANKRSKRPCPEMYHFFFRMFQD